MKINQMKKWIDEQENKKTFPTHKFIQKKKWWPEDAQTIVAQSTKLGKGSLSTIAYQSSLFEENIRV